MSKSPVTAISVKIVGLVGAVVFTVLGPLSGATNSLAGGLLKNGGPVVVQSGHGWIG